MNEKSRSSERLFCGVTGLTLLTGVTGWNGEGGDDEGAGVFVAGGFGGADEVPAKGGVGEGEGEGDGVVFFGFAGAASAAFCAARLGDGETGRGGDWRGHGVARRWARSLRVRMRLGRVPRFWLAG